MGVITERERQKYFAYLDGVADGLNESRNDVNSVLDKIKAEILDSAFSVVNPKNTYEYINVLDLDSIERILNKYKAETEIEDGNVD